MHIHSCHPASQRKQTVVMLRTLSSNISMFTACHGTITLSSTPRICSASSYCFGMLPGNQDRHPRATTAFDPPVWMLLLLRSGVGPLHEGAQNAGRHGPTDPERCPGAEVSRSGYVGPGTGCCPAFCRCHACSTGFTITSCQRLE